MKKILLQIVSLTVLLAFAACGPSDAEKKARLEAVAAQIDSLVSTNAAPIVASGARYEEPNVVVYYTLADSMISTDFLGEELFDYYVSEELRTFEASTFKQITKSLSENESGLTVAITDVYGKTKNFIFTPEKLTNLAKAKRSSLNVPKVKEQVVALANAAVPAPAANAGAQVSTAIESGFLTYTITWPSKKAFASYSQGVLVSLYKEALQNQYSALGILEYPMVDLYKSLGVDGVRIVYAAVDSKDQLKQAFPWREIFK